MTCDTVFITYFHNQLPGYKEGHGGQQCYSEGLLYLYLPAFDLLHIIIQRETQVQVLNTIYEATYCMEIICVQPVQVSHLLIIHWIIIIIIISRSCCFFIFVFRIIMEDLGTVSADTDTVSMIERDYFCKSVPIVFLGRSYMFL